MQEQQSAPQGTSSQTPAMGAANSAQSLFNSIDTDGDGVISQAELEKAVTAAGGTTAQADALFNKISGGNGSVSENQLASALQKADGHHRHHHLGGTGGTQDGPDSGDPLSGLMGGSTADGATSQVMTNTDGSTTTKLTYADGTTITMTNPASAGSGSGSSSGSDASTTGAGANGGPAQNQQDMRQMLAMLIKMQASMAQSPQVTALAA